MRIVIAQDAVFLRKGLAGLPEDAGHSVLARVSDGDSTRAVVAKHDPDLAIVDVRMPPTLEDECMRAAADIRQAHTRTAVLVLSQHIESRHAVALVSSGGGFGYRGHALIRLNPCRAASSQESTRTQLQPLFIPRSQVRSLPIPRRRYMQSKIGKRGSVSRHAAAKSAVPTSPVKSE
jgi:CheY-like chemotaxis protein